jgi:DNA polymerase
MGLYEELKAEVAKCTRCAELAGYRTQTVIGDGNIRSKVLMVGEAPGEDEDRQGIPFVGRAGKFLTNSLEELGITRAMYYITNTVKCRPPENRQPEPEEILNCSGFLAAQIALMKPRIIVALGRFGMQELMKKDMKISEVHGKPIRSKDGVIFFPMFHPAAALRKAMYHDDFLTDCSKLRKLLDREKLI